MDDTTDVEHPTTLPDMDHASPDTTKDEGQALINAAKQSSPPNILLVSAESFLITQPNHLLSLKHQMKLWLMEKHTAKFIYMPHSMSLL